MNESKREYTIPANDNDAEIVRQQVAEGIIKGAISKGMHPFGIESVIVADQLGISRKRLRTAYDDLDDQRIVEYRPFRDFKLASEEIIEPDSLPEKLGDMVEETGVRLDVVYQSIRSRFRGLRDQLNLPD